MVVGVGIQAFQAIMREYDTLLTGTIGMINICSLDILRCTSFMVVGVGIHAFQATMREYDTLLTGRIGMINMCSLDTLRDWKAKLGSSSISCCMQHSPGS